MQRVRHHNLNHTSYVMKQTSYYYFSMRLVSCTTDKKCSCAGHKKRHSGDSAPFLSQWPSLIWWGRSYHLYIIIIIIKALQLHKHADIKVHASESSPSSPSLLFIIYFLSSGMGQHLSLSTFPYLSFASHVCFYLFFSNFINESLEFNIQNIFFKIIIWSL